MMWERLQPCSLKRVSNCFLLSAVSRKWKLCEWPQTMEWLRHRHVTGSGERRLESCLRRKGTMLLWFRPLELLLYKAVNILHYGSCFHGDVPEHPAKVGSYCAAPFAWANIFSNVHCPWDLKGERYPAPLTGRNRPLTIQISKTSTIAKLL